MTELFLKWTDENGVEQKIPVEQEEFIVGRHSENDLSIINGKLSRQHIKIQRFADVFVVSDMNSSNGTKLNDSELDEPESLKNGDVLNLGGGLDIEIELIDPNAQSNSSKDEDKENSEKAASASSAAGASGGSSGATTSVASQTNGGGGGSGLGKALILAPILGLFLVFFAIGGILLFGGKSEPEIARNDDDDTDFVRSSTRVERDEDSGKDESKSKNEENSGETAVTENGQTQTAETIPTTEEILNPDDSGNGGAGGSTSSPPTVEESDDTGKVRNNSFNFMRKIATSNQKPVLLNNQLSLLEKKVGQFKGSSALAGNIKNARSNASAIQNLARANNIQPQFLATAALAKLGSQSGNVLATAQGMADVFKNLQIQIGNEDADSNLIMIASYDQGVRNDFLAMRNTLQRLADQNPNRSSEIRTIWFLREKGAINESQFEFALRFLAIGTITQNPKAFNVNSEALILN